jgi:hypothetical protein
LLHTSYKFLTINKTKNHLDHSLRSQISVPISTSRISGCLRVLHGWVRKPFKINALNQRVPILENPIGNKIVSTTVLLTPRTDCAGHSISIISGVPDTDPQDP